MTLFASIAAVIFLLGYLLITLEHRLGTHKSAIALAVGGILWVLVAISGKDRHIISHDLEVTAAEIFHIVAFLLAAMALVEILIHYRFFDVIRAKLYALNLNDQKQFLLIALLTFFLSAVLDNLTVTIVMIQIARRFFNGNNLLVVVSGIVILANAGGAWSPIGDVTTIMLWLAGKFTAAQVIVESFLPALVLGLVAAAMLVRQVKNDTKDSSDEIDVKLSRDEKIVVGLALSSFALPLAMNGIGLQPYIGLLMGLGIVWGIIELLKIRTKKQTHLNANIDDLLRKVDLSSIKFFIGILLAVSALGTLGVLDQLSHILVGANPDEFRIIISNVILGLMSAVFDNVPLTALAMDVFHMPDPGLWVLLALTVGTGGSFLIIGSVAGVVAMGMTKGLTFERYLKIASIPALAAYIAGIATWIVQYELFFK